MAGLNFDVPWYLADAVDYLLNGGTMHDGWSTGPHDEAGRTLLEQLRRCVRQNLIPAHDNFIVRYLADGSLQQQGPLPHVWPEEVIKWAIDLGIPVCSECVDYYELISSGSLAHIFEEKPGGLRSVFPSAAPTVKSPSGIPTPDMARCFAVLHGWDYEGWHRNLGDPAKWMQPALVTRRNRPDPHLWNPVILALELMKHDKKVPHKEITRRFETRTELEHWLDDCQPFAEALTLKD